MSRMQPYQTYTPRRPIPPRQPRRKPYIRHVVSFAIVVLLTMIGLRLAFPQKGSAAVHHVALQTRTAAQQQQALATMTEQVNGIIAANSDIDIAVTVTDLRSAQSSNYGVDVPFEGASIGKLITAADFLHQTEKGTESLGETLEDGNTARYDLQQMIVISDDSAWQALNDELGDTSLDSYAASIGITDYDASVNNLKTEDIAKLLQKLYDGSLLKTAERTLLLGYMKQANYRNYIVPVVPGGVSVYHKVGLLDDRIHDAAIVDNKVNPIVLVIFTNGHGVYDSSARQRIIQSITQSVLTGYDIK